MPTPTPTWAPRPTPTPTPYAGLPSCGSRTDIYTVPPVALSDVRAIWPLGNLNPPGHTFPSPHIYFMLRTTAGAGGQQAPVEVPLYAPGDLKVVSLRAQEHLSEDPPYSDYSIAFAPCAELRGYFNHVTSLAPLLLEQLKPPYQQVDEYETGGKRYRVVDKAVSISVKAGELLATAGGRTGQWALDFGARDMGAPPLAYANPARWYEEMQHVACPIDYYRPDVRASLEAKLGREGQPRTVPPVCGEVEQDEAGTAQGVWFIPGAQTFPEDPHLSLVHDNTDPATPVFSVGASLEKSGLAPGVYPFTPRGSGLVDREFRDVTPDGKVYCYQPHGVPSQSWPSIILLQLTSATTLRIERQQAQSCGAGPWTFTDKYTDFER